jgi:hypothetical protein
MMRLGHGLLLRLSLILFLGVSAFCIHGVAEGSDFMIGVKIYDFEGDIANLIKRWKELGVNAAFVSADLAQQGSFMALVRSNHIATYIILPIFQNPEMLAANPGYYAVTGKGKRAEEDWVKFVCPNRNDYRMNRLAYIKHLVETCQPDGLSIDFIRYFIFWEKVYPDTKLDPLEYACFCPNCLRKFQADEHLNIPHDLVSVTQQSEWILRNHRREWVSWKCGTISSMVREIAAEARAVKPDIRLNVHLVPWRESDFDQGVRSIVGQDVAEIAAAVDMLSPMCYAHMVKQDASWISSVVRDVSHRADKPVIPSVQVKETYLTEKLTVGEFARDLKEVRKPPSAGVIFWNWPMLADDAEKANLLVMLKNP